jgi:hypothetical protein
MSAENRPDQVLDAIPVGGQPPVRYTCSHCGSNEIRKGMKLGLSGESGEVGCRYHKTGKFLGMSLLGLEPLLVDVCMDCGTLVRIYMEETDRKWT